MKITVYNYRNFQQDNPIAFEIREGITFFLGPNNVGKTNILKFLTDVRSILIRYPTTYNQAADYNIDLPTNFDQIVNRNSNHESIKFEIENEYGFKIVYLVTHPSERRQPTHARVHIELQNVPINSKQSQEFQNSLSGLGTKSFTIGQLRTISPNTSGKIYDMEIGSAFITKYSEWADGDDIQKRKKISELKEELRLLFGYNKFELRVNSGKTDFIITNDDGEFSLLEMGTGISHFILTLTNALIYNPDYIFCDEPESSLHPRMQEIFVRALASKAKKALIATTHYVGMARSTGDYIYSLTRHDNKIFIEPYGKHYKPTIAQSINELGYSQFVEIGGNNLLLVEGRTDIKTFREILRKYEIETSFIIMSFGGGQFMSKDESKIIDELNELKRLNAKSINVIFDGEKTSETCELDEIHKIFKETCEGLSFNVFPTDKHSTENYITQDAIDKIVGSGHIALAPYENFNLRTLKWQKEKNWLMLREMSRHDFLNTGLDLFIRSTLTPLTD